MIQLTLLDGRKRLFNPAFIQEVGDRICTQHGFAPHHDYSGPLEERNFIVMTGGSDPLDIVETPDEVALLKCAWEARGDLSPHPISGYTFFTETDGVGYAGVPSA